MTQQFDYKQAFECRECDGFAVITRSIIPLPDPCLCDALSVLINGHTVCTESECVTHTETTRALLNPPCPKCGVAMEETELCDRCEERPQTHEGRGIVAEEMGFRQYGTVKLCDKCDPECDEPWFDTLEEARGEI